MEIDDFILQHANEGGAIITKLQCGKEHNAPIERAAKQLDVYQHAVMNQSLRPDKKVIVDTPLQDGELSVYDRHTEVKLEAVARVPLALQKLIANRMAAFTFGLDALVNADTEDENETRVFEAVKKVFADNKINAFNLDQAIELYSFTETAELWWVEQTPTNRYGFESPLRLKVTNLSPSKGDLLYPYFDERGKMVAFSRQFTSKEIGTDTITTYFETYTDTAHYLWQSDNKHGWALAEGYPAANAIGKIPIIYAAQPETEWHDVQPLIDRLEKLLSNFADTNDYHASPKIFVKGHINGFAQKGEAGAILEGDNDSSAEYLSWANAPESVKLEIDTLWRNIHTITQIPDISWDSVKGLNVSGVALKLMFSDTHLKVRSKRAIWDDYLQRRINVVKAFLRGINATDIAFATACESVLITPEIVPFILDDEQSTINALLSATGQKAIMSRQTAVRTLNFTQNADKELQRIAEEEAQGALEDISELTQL